MRRSSKIFRQFKYAPNISRVSRSKFNTNRLLSIKSKWYCGNRQYSKINLSKTLTPHQHTILDREKTCLQRISGIISRIDHDDYPADKKILQNSIQDLEEFFQLAVVGEFNVGKSTFLNAFIGKEILKQGVTPTTSKINYIRYGDEYKEETNGITNIELPSSMLKHLVLIDTPGLNSLYSDHDKLTKDFIPRSDIIFFLTSSNQVFNNTEKNIFEYIKNKKKKIVILISKKDSLSSKKDLDEVQNYLASHFEEKIGYTPPIIPISSKLALESYETDDIDKKNKLYADSGFNDVKHYLADNLNDLRKTKIKFMNGINTATIVLDKYDGICDVNKTDMKERISEVVDIENNNYQYESAMDSYLKSNYEDIDRLLDEMEEKIKKLIDDNVRISQFRILFNKKKFAEKFSKDIVINTNEALTIKIDQMIDYSSVRGDKFYERIKSELCKKFSDIRGINYDSSLVTHRDEIIEKSVGSFKKRYDAQKEIPNIIDNIRNTYFNTIAIELTTIFGIGLFTQLPLITLPFDPVILPACGVAAGVFGFALLPYKRRQLKNKIDETTKSIKNEIKQTLTNFFDDEKHKNMSRIQGIIEPHIKILSNKVDNISNICDNIKEEKELINLLKKDINKL